MDKVRKIVRQILKESEEFKKPKVDYPIVMYYAVVIEDSSEEQKIIDIANKYVPKDWNSPAHYHMTIGHGAFPSSLRIRGDFNREIELTLEMVGNSDKAIALLASGYYSKNEMPHITIGYNGSNGGAPADSNNIENWKPIDKVVVKGVIREVGEGGKILKESSNKEKVVADFETMDIMLGDKVVGDFHMYDRRQYKKNSKYLTLSKIEINPEYRNMGYATQVMNQIIEYANKNNLIIVLTPDAYKPGGLSTSKLKDWYKSLGFIMNKGKNKDFETMQLMYKLPVKLDEMIDSTNSQTTGSIRAYPGVPEKFPQMDDFDQFGNKIE
jgi:N-acetylglutamate synthase-like GNAT family acetyltransferase